MNIEVTEAVENKHRPNTYEVDVEIMHGDADSFEHLIIGPFSAGDEEDFKNLTDLLTTLERMQLAFPNGRGGGGRDNYDNVEGFARWFVGVFDDKTFEYGEEPIFWKYSSGDEECWPVDSYDYETHGNPWKVVVYFYDENLNTFHTKVELP